METQDEKNQALFNAIAASPFIMDNFIAALENGADVNAPDAVWWKPLHNATQNNNLEVIDLLVKNGAEVDAQHALGWTSLHIAIDKNHFDAIKLLARHGADLDFGVIENESIPLRFAINNKKFEAAELLAELGADLGALDVDGHAALHIAACVNDLEAIKLLARLGADINIPNENEWTPLHIAASENNLEAIELLTKLGANPNTINMHGQTPLHTAAYTHTYSLHYLETIKLLIKLGADPDIKNGNVTLWDLITDKEAFEVRQTIKYEAAKDEITQGFLLNSPKISSIARAKHFYTSLSSLLGTDDLKNLSSTCVAANPDTLQRRKEAKIDIESPTARASLKRKEPSPSTMHLG